MKELKLPKHEPLRRHGTMWVTLGSALLAAACSGGGGGDDTAQASAAASALRAPASFTIQRSAHGVPHITAPTPELAAQGLGQAFAEDNFCLLQQTVLTVNGDRSRVLGPNAMSPEHSVSNLESDFFFRYVLDTAHWRRLFDAAPATSRLMAGYLRGFNSHFTSNTRASIDPTCAAFARELTLDDLARVVAAKQLRAGSVQFLSALVKAQPPAPGTPAPTAQPAAASTLFDTVPLRPMASNGWAFGRDMVSNGKALLFANPHFPWEGSDRFYEARMTVPGVYDLSGVTLPGVPLIAIGYNQHLAWTHTISAARRFTLHELTLKVGDPLTYIVDGVEKKMQAVALEVPLGSFGTASQPVAKRTLYRTEFGPMFAGFLGLTWQPHQAYAFQDVNLDNGRALDTWYQFAQVRSVRELRSLLQRDLTMPYFNTIAADDSGEVMYADVGAVPRVEAADIERCKPSDPAAFLLQFASIVVLRGNEVACNWKAPAPAPHTASVLPGERQPSVIRTDYVLNSNDSYWLANPEHSFPADLSPILGPVGKPQSLRTRYGLSMVRARQAGTDGLPGTRFDGATTAALWFRNENFGARLVLDDLLSSQCGAAMDPGFADACRVLAAWDRTSRLDAPGAALFREFWRRMTSLPPIPGNAFFAVPFKPTEPIDTPRGLKADAATAALVAAQLKGAITTLQSQGVAVNATLRQLQIATVGQRKLPVPGGEEFEGVANKVISGPLVEGRYNAFAGTTYLQAVALGELGVGPGTGRTSNARGFMVMGQSSDRRSPFFGDQMEYFSESVLRPLPDLR